MTWLAIIVFALMAAHSASAQMQCVLNNGSIQAQLVERYDETIIEQQDMPTGRGELWANDETGSYTILFFPNDWNDDVVCMIGSGFDTTLIDNSEPV